MAMRKKAKNKKRRIKKDEKIKLLAFQERLNELKNIEALSYYGESFTVVNTLHDSYVLFRLIASPMRPMSAGDVDYTVSALAGSYVTLDYEIGYIIDTDYLNLTAQKRFWQRKLEQTSDEGRINYIQEKLVQFEAAEKHGQREVYYIKVMGIDSKDALKNAYNFSKTFRVYIPVSLSIVEAKRLLRFEHNPNERRKRDEELI
jgi:hypothetical protein